MLWFDTAFVQIYSVVLIGELTGLRPENKLSRHWDYEASGEARQLTMNIHHIGIVVRDFERMLTFYREAFGFKVLGTELNIPKERAEEISREGRPKPNMRVIMMQAGNCYLEIMGNADAAIQNHSSPATGYVQLCIDVDDIDAEYARLKDIGMTFDSAAAVDFGHVKAVIGRDPGGNVSSWYRQSGTGTATWWSSCPVKRSAPSGGTRPSAAIAAFLFRGCRAQHSRPGWIAAKHAVSKIGRAHV